MLRFLVSLLVLASCKIAKAETTVASARASLVRQEDTIIFALIERSRFPLNSPTYNQNYTSVQDSILDFVVHNTEAVDTLILKKSFLHKKFTTLGCATLPLLTTASININKDIWKLYFSDLLPLFVASDDDGNYAQTAAADLTLLQAISRRIHYGKFVAEAKFRENPKAFEPSIRAKDREALLKLLTLKKIEEMVVKRVEKKAMVLGQDVNIDNDIKKGGKYKVDPSIASLLYQKWLIPLTKNVELEYLLKRFE
ncbi:hypothetical protein ACSQ67_018683 [Phaseolus vulgaris]